MSRCPTDGPVLKSILGLYRPAADCPLSLSCCFISLSLSVSTNLFFFFFFYTHCHLSSPISPSLPSPMSISAPLSCPVSPSLPPLSYLWPSFAFSLASCGVIVQIALSALTLSVSVFLPLLFLSVRFLIVSLSPGVSPLGS